MVFFPTLAQAKSILVLGDSISANHGFEAQHGWVTLLQQKLNASHAEYTIYNASISGDTSAGGLARLPQLLKLYKPEILLLELGANDGLRGMSLISMQKNLSTIIAEAKKSGAEVLLLSMRIPSNYGKRYTDMFYSSYEKVAREQNISVVPFILNGIALDKSQMQNDGLHPNEKAQPIIANHVAAYLLPLL
ncbi:arylesterase [Bathymodiolus japonicus methanotrophic gill symbiont]|uniref:arylesterase n=1 Tax=Bathymodiolus japonicus methanotrophic gill symbiont TaxID=113269 RepID=UPI001C8EFD23|nr:arylesterase [Bathymodiolus japonicus methanotrophic gill symbiont]